ncbi:hypothetical protein [Haloarcula litorea]|uniref:hypothetical protein n=1 Tax=Haloarcula litorea TaxID=3032579 RepID=UPI0023E7DB86|nr:hypothetical protein [Halomicroarcula sp. GDY20]
MSIALAHFALGATLTTLAVTYLVPGVGYPRTLILAGGGWAMLPDAHQVAPVARETLYEVHRSSPLTDLFWFHRTLDAADPGDSTVVAAALLACLIVATLLAERRSHEAPAAVVDAYEAHLGVEHEE